MSRSLSEREKFIEMIEETPFLSYVCRKMRLSRTTVYRWKKSNLEFKEKLDRALESGRNNVSDMAETILVQKVQAGDMVAIKFWLQHNNHKYVPVRTVYVEPPHEHGKRRPGVPCKECGHTEIGGSFDPHNSLPPQPKKRSQLTKDILRMQHKKMREDEILREFGRRPRSLEDNLAAWDDYDSEIKPPESKQT